MYTYVVYCRFFHKSNAELKIGSLQIKQLIQFPSRNLAQEADSQQIGWWCTNQDMLC